MYLLRDGGGQPHETILGELSLKISDKTFGLLCYIDIRDFSSVASLNSNVRTDSATMT